MIAASQTLSSPLNPFTVWNLFESFNGNLIVMGQLFQEFKIFLEAIAHLLWGNIQGFSWGQHFFDELTVCHIRSFFKSWGFWLKRGLRGRFLSQNILKRSDNLNQSLCKSFEFSHEIWDWGNLYKSVERRSHKISNFRSLFGCLNFDWMISEGFASSWKVGRFGWNFVYYIIILQELILNFISR